MESLTEASRTPPSPQASEGEARNQIKIKAFCERSCGALGVLGTGCSDAGVQKIKKTRKRRLPK